LGKEGVLRSHINNVELFKARQVLSHALAFRVELDTTAPIQDL